MKKLLAVLMCLGLLGCATGYQSKSFTGGYTDMKLQDNIYRISFSGNGHTGKERTANFALLRSAEITLDNGYKYFVLVEGNTDVKTSIDSSDGDISMINKPSTNMTIKCFKDKPTNVSGMVYDAEQIKANIRKAYKLDEGVKKENVVDQRSINSSNNESNVVSLNNSWMSNMNNQKYDLALKDINQAVSLEPNNANHYVSRCYTYGYMSQYDKSIADCNRALEISPNNRMAYVFRAISYEGTGQHSKACEDIDKVNHMNGDIDDGFLQSLNKIKCN